MSELKNKSKGELMKILADKRQGLHTFHFTIAGGKVKNVKEGKMIRKEIARVMTALKTAR
jgi:ribosomal protein L29